MPYSYTAHKVSQGIISEVNLDNFQDTGRQAILPVSQAHVITSDGSNYIYVGTLGSPVRVYKIRVSDLAVIDNQDFSWII